MQDEVTQIYIEDKILEYVTSLVMNTREQEMVRLGVSPRGALAVTRLAKAKSLRTGKRLCHSGRCAEVFWMSVRIVLF